MENWSIRIPDTAGEFPEWSDFEAVGANGGAFPMLSFGKHALEVAMSLQPKEITPVPDETVRVARAAFPRGNAWLSLRDELGTIYNDEMFAGLYPKRGQPAEAPWRLALVLVMQFADGLSDRQAAEAVRSRIDWKYLLSLELTDPGFDSTVLAEFRTRLVEGELDPENWTRLLIGAGAVPS